MSSRYRHWLMFFLVALASVIALSPSTQASIWYVSTTGSNANAGTEVAPWRNIQYAISTSATISGDTVIVENGTYTENLVLNSKDLVIASRYIFTSNISDRNNTIIDGDAGGSVVAFTSDAALIGFTITNGEASDGGGIYANECNPRLSYLLVQGNHATGNGGGLYFIYSDPVLSNLTVTSNSSNNRGGGLYAESGTIELSNSTVSQNTAFNGGGAYLYQIEADINGLIVSNNAASEDGGGLYMQAVTGVGSSITAYSNESLSRGAGIFASQLQMSLTALSLTNNTATNSGGGGMYAGVSILIIDSSSIGNNIAQTNGGGIFADECVLKITNTTLDSNRALGSIFSGNGGALFLLSSAAYVYDSHFYNNTAAASGGAIMQDNLFFGVDSLPAAFDGLVQGIHRTAIHHNEAGSGGGYAFTGFDGRGMPTSELPPTMPAISIENCTINYNSVSHFGGAIYMTSGALSVLNSTMTYNTSLEGGGGLYLQSSQAAILASVVEYNYTLARGGGLCAIDTDVYADSTSFSYNTVDLDIDFISSGGGVYHQRMHSADVPLMPSSSGSVSDSGEPSYRRVIIQHNTANEGGGMALKEVALSVQNSMIYANTASGHHGGGLYIDDSQVIIDSTAFMFNRANESSGLGGALFAIMSNIFMKNSLASSNTAFTGGGLYYDAPYNGLEAAPAGAENYLLGFDNVQVLSNSARRKGGVAIEDISAVLTRSQIDGNIATSGDAGGVFIDDARILLDSTTIQNNSATGSGGGLYVTHSNVYATGATISYNDGLANGGGVFILDSYEGVTMPASGTLPALTDIFNSRTPGFAHTEIAHNTSNGNGGGVYIMNQSLEMRDVVLRNNNALGSGGGIYLVTNANIQLANTSIAHNTAGGNGGGLYANGARPRIDNSTVSSNVSGAQGGGVYVGNANPILLSNITVADNSSANSGGGLYLGSLTATVTNANVRGNRAAGYGGGGIFMAASNGVFDNLVLSGNFGKRTLFTGCDGGGGFYASACSSIVMKNPTIVGNKSAETAGALLLSSSNLVLMNGIIWANDAVGVNDNIRLCSLATARVYHTIMQSGDALTESSNILECNPRFVSGLSPSWAPTTGGDFHLESRSPAIGAAVPFVVVGADTVAVPTSDIELNARSTTFDMGAYENPLSIPAAKVLAYNDTAIACGIGAIMLDVMENDYSPSEDGFSVISYTQGTQGTVSVEDYFLVYTPTALFSGVDTFTYTVSTANCGVGTTATVVILSDPIMAPIAITGGPTARTGTSYVYSVASSANLSYSWSVVNGSIVSSSGNSITVAWNDIANGSITVTAATVLGCSESATHNVRIYHSGPVFYVCSSGSNITGTGSELWPLEDVDLALDLANDGDTVLICPGTYDDIRIESNIVVGSWFLTTGDTSYIEQTILNSDRDYTTVVFDLAPGSTATLVGLTITGGENFSADGGGIHISPGSRPVLRDLVVTDNLSGAGGGIFIGEESAPVLSNITVSENSVVGYGGGICIASGASPILNNIVVRNNESLSAGGGIYMIASNPVLSNVTVADNTSGDYGGGIFSFASTPVLESCVIEGNEVLDGDGGGMYLVTEIPLVPLPDEIVATTTGTIINNSIFRHNTASRDGGAAFFTGSLDGLRMPNATELLDLSAPKTLSITNTVIDSNYAANNGGGVAFSEVTPYVSNVTVADNSCGSDGGGIYIRSMSTIPLLPTEAGLPAESMRIDSSVVKRNTAASFGGGVVMVGSKGCIECQPTSEFPIGPIGAWYFNAVEIDSNSAGDNGGGIAMINRITLALEYSHVSHNNAAGSGGALYADDAEALITHSTLDSNRSSANGGAVATNEAHIVITGGSVSSNTSISGSGGGMFLELSILSVSSATISHNTAFGTGGALTAIETYMSQLANSTFAYNSSGDQGGALYVEDTPMEVLIENVVFDHNSSSAHGGAISAKFGTMSVNSSELTHNTASGLGGAVAAQHLLLTLNQSVVRDNSTDSSGGGVSLENANFAADRSTISSNTAGRDGGGVYSYFSQPTLTNTTVAGNSAGGEGGGIYRYSTYSAGLPAVGSLPAVNEFITNVVISGNYAGSTNSCFGGGGIAVKNVGTLSVLQNATITGNRAANAGGGLMASAAPVALVNSIVWDNSAGNEQNISRCSGAQVAALYGILSANEVDTSYAIVECSPLFTMPVSASAAPTTAGNLRLLDNSPAIGSGAHEVALTVGTVTVFATDIVGTARGSVPDLGAYENARAAALRTLVANDDTTYGCLNTPVVVDVLSNDTDSGVLSFVEYSQGTSGTVSVSSEPYALRYTPNNGFVGTDSFMYVVSTNGCARPDTALVVVHISAFPDPVISGTTAVCSFSTHTFAVEDLNSVAATYQWYVISGRISTPVSIVSGASTSSVTVQFDELATNATYTLAVAAATATGCVMEKTIAITGYTQPVAHAGSDFSACENSNVMLGAMTGTVTGGSGQYSYSWTPSSGLSDATAAMPTLLVNRTATYAVEVVDLVTGCSSTDSVTVTMYKRPALVLNTTTGCGGRVTTYAVTDTNNTGAVISWMTEAISCGTVVENTNGVLSVLWSTVSEATTCELTVSALTPQECGSLSTFNITITPSATPSISGDLSICRGAAYSYTVSDDNSTGASYTWSVVGGSIVEGASSATVSVLWSSVGEGSTGEVRVVATTPAGCVSETSVDVELNNNPVVSVAGVDSVFASTLHEYTATATGSSLVYRWQIDGGVIEGSTTGSLVSVRWNSGLAVTTVGSVSVTVTSDKGCSTLAQLPVTVYPFIPVDIAGDSTTVGDTTGVYGVAGVDTTAAAFSWSVSPGGTIVGSATTASVVVEWDDVDEPTTGTLTVAVLTVDGGTGSTTFTVTIYPRPILTISGSFSVCSNAEQVYTVADSRNTGSSFGWFVSGGSVIGSSTGASVTVKWGTVSSLTTASLLVVGYEPHGFDGSSTASVALYPNPALAIAGANEVCGTTIASYAVSDAHATGIASFQWTVSGGRIVGSASNAAVEVEWDNVSVRTTRTLTVSGSGANGCAHTVSLDVDVYPLPQLVLSGTAALCEQTVAVYTVVDTVAGGTVFTWSVSGGSLLSGQSTTTATVLWTVPGERSIAVSAVAAKGCSNSLTMPVQVFAKPQPEIAGLREVCADSVAVLDAGAGYASYLWSNGDTTRTTTVLSSGVYSVSVVTPDGCSASTSATITYLPPVVAQAGTDVEICYGAGTRLQGVAVSYIGAVEFQWSPTTGLSNPHIADPIASPTTTTTYTLLVADGYGCVATDQVTVFVKPEPNIQVTGNTVVCTGGATQVFVSGGVSYSWFPTVGVSDPSAANPVITPTSTATYTVTVLSTNACTVQRSVTITVVDPLFANAGADVEICAGGSAQLQASGGVSYSWSPTTGLSNPSIANPIASPTETTVYTVTMTGLGECISSDQVTVVVRPLELDITAMLEGPFNGSSMTTALQQQDLIPAAQPFNVAPFNYAGAETLNGGVRDVVDWVLLELRSDTLPGAVIGRKAALLTANGKIVDTDGSTVTLGGVPAGATPVYVAVWHRNHLPVMSRVRVAPDTLCTLSYNFTSSLPAAYTQFMNAQKQLAVSVFGLISGDVNADGIVNANDRVLINNTAGQIGYRAEDISLDGIINALDRVRVRENAFFVSQVP